MNDVFAAPASALPSLPTALVSQDASCANADPAAKLAIMAAKNIRFIGCLPKLEKFEDWSLKFRHDQGPTIVFRGQNQGPRSSSVLKSARARWASARATSDASASPK